jgi:hypothetical protein
MPVRQRVPGAETDATTARRERRARRGSTTAEPLDFNAKRERRARRASAAAEPPAAAPAAPDVADAGSGTASAGAVAPLPAASAATADTLAGAVADTKASRSTRALARAARTQQEAAAALEAGEHPALGALHRHLNLLTQQLETAHRVVGRVAAERDALRQQLADLEGIPVEQIVVTSIAAATDERGARTREHGHGEHRAAKLREHGEPLEATPPSAMARLNYFRHDDIAVMRRRRQVAALCLLGVILVLWSLSKLGRFQLPENLGKDSLAQLPVVGELMSYMLAGWVFYRVIKMGGKGVKWIFPSEPKHKRR